MTFEEFKAKFEGKPVILTKSKIDSHTIYIHTNMRLKPSGKISFNYTRNNYVGRGYSTLGRFLALGPMIIEEENLCGNATLNPETNAIPEANAIIDNDFIRPMGVSDLYCNCNTPKIVTNSAMGSVFKVCTNCKKERL